MPRDASLWRWLRNAVLLSAFLGLPLGYVVFYGIYPTLTVPAASAPDLLGILVALVVPGFLAGLATEDLRALMVQLFGALIVGGGVATAVLVSPILTGTILVNASDLPFYVLQYGFALMFLGLVVNFVTMIGGLAVRESVLLRYRRYEPAPWERNRK